MKRSVPFPISDLTTPRRKRALSEEEHALWESVARQVKPLRKKPRPPTLQAAESQADKATARPKPSPRPIAPVVAPKLANSERGVLRRQVPQWLSLPQFRALVVGFEQAHLGHGGEGALYVRIRRARA